MRNDGKPGMSDEEVGKMSLPLKPAYFIVLQWKNKKIPPCTQVMDFVSRYLPAYKAYLPTLYSEGPKGADPNHLLVVEIDEGRNPILGN